VVELRGDEAPEQHGEEERAGRRDGAEAAGDDASGRRIAIRREKKTTGGTGGTAR
jgi:hypothetical protein